MKLACIWLASCHNCHPLKSHPVPPIRRGWKQPFYNGSKPLKSSFVRESRCKLLLCLCHLAKGDAFRWCDMFSGFPPATFFHSLVHLFVRLFVNLSGQILLPWYVMNGSSNLLETFREYSLAPTNDLVKFWRSKWQMHLCRRWCVKVRLLLYTF